MITDGIKMLVEGRDLPNDLARNIMEEIMTGKATGSQIAAFATALRMKGETVSELTTFAKTMRKFSVRIHPNCSGGLVDTCGTGGGSVRTFNVSTVAAFVTAGAGVKVAKHGNHSFTGLCGSADLMAHLGFNLSTEPAKVEKAIEEHGIGFMYAPVFHPAMHHASAPRREIAIRTFFNYLGPLTNPADAEAQLLGVSERTMVPLVAETLMNLGCAKAMVVHGMPGLDEFSTSGPSYAIFINNGKALSRTFLPEEIGLQRHRVEELSGGCFEENAKIAIKILRGLEHGARQDFVLANAAAAILVGGQVKDLREGVEAARVSVESGEAYRKLRVLVQQCGDIGRLDDLVARYG